MYRKLTVREAFDILLKSGYVCDDEEKEGSIYLVKVENGELIMKCNPHFGERPYFVNLSKVFGFEPGQIENNDEWIGFKKDPALLLDMGILRMRFFY